MEAAGEPAEPHLSPPKGRSLRLARVVVYLVALLAGAVVLPEPWATHAPSLPGIAAFLAFLFWLVDWARGRTFWLPVRHQALLIFGVVAVGCLLFALLPGGGGWRTFAVQFPLLSLLVAMQGADFFGQVRPLRLFQAATVAVALIVLGVQVLMPRPALLPVGVGQAAVLAIAYLISGSWWGSVFSKDRLHGSLDYGFLRLELLGEGMRRMLAVGIRRRRAGEDRRLFSGQ